MSEAKPGWESAQVEPYKDPAMMRVICGGYVGVIGISDTPCECRPVRRFDSSEACAADHEDLVSRITECVSTCEGIHDPSDLRRQRDELLEACEQLAEWHRMVAGPNPRLDGIGFPNILESAIEMAEAAILKATGKEPQ